ncbi:hypothetical protein DWG20_06545 [Crenobacter cavernae]|uniref:Uncharacterized protein n=1 Tax=Crenobacter cavernae TaxID=2290923 RepID=A0A345Y5B4_9NEIS|nr:hypothetical protein DWG20_06545 [Crenobacter cavernae]
MPTLLAGCAAPGRDATVSLTPTAVASSSTTCIQRPIDQVRLDGEDFFGDLLDSQFCQIPKDNVQFRLFRTQLLITMLAHYGHERFKDHSAQPTTDAYKLL